MPPARSGPASTWARTADPEAAAGMSKVAEVARSELHYPGDVTAGGGGPDAHLRPARDRAALSPRPERLSGSGARRAKRWRRTSATLHGESITGEVKEASDELLQDKTKPTMTGDCGKTESGEPQLAERPLPVESRRLDIDGTFFSGDESPPHVVLVSPPPPLLVVPVDAPGLAPASEDGRR